MQNQMSKRQKLYKQGLKDGQIARIQQVSPNAVAHWRKRNGLPVNTVAQKAPRPVAQCRKFLYDLEWRDPHIAKEQRVSAAAVLDWRRSNSLPANQSNAFRRRQDRARQIHDLQDRIVKAIGTSLPRDIAADAAADLMLAVVSGSVPISDIEKRARSFGNRALQEFANAYLSRSLDETIDADGDLRRIDMLVDESSSDWLEEMGATWH